MYYGARLMISDELEKALQELKSGEILKHQYMTLEHLLSLCSDNDVIKVLDACVIDKDKLKKLEKFVRVILEI